MPDITGNGDKFDELLALMREQIRATNQGFTDLREETQQLREVTRSLDQRIEGFDQRLTVGLREVRAEITRMHQAAEQQSRDLRGEIRWLGNFIVNRGHELPGRARASRGPRNGHRRKGWLTACSGATNG